MKTKYLLLLFAALLLIGFGSCKKKEGCTDATASNFDPEAKKDDGSCIFPVEGCTDPDAINYDPDAEVDDGNCTFAKRYAPVQSGNTWTLEDEIVILTQNTPIEVLIEQYKDTTIGEKAYVLQRETITAGTFPPQITRYAYRWENSGIVYRARVYADSVGADGIFMQYPLELGTEWYDTPSEDNLLCKVISNTLLSVPAGDFNDAIGIEYTDLDTSIPTTFYFAKDVGPVRVDIDYEVPILGQINVQAELTSYTVN